ncbi:MAG: beta-galactosidase [Candidatus Nealsonbacteria bacterium]
MKIIFKTMLLFLTILIVIFLLITGYFFVGSAKPAQNISWGVVFSQKHAKYLRLDWQKTYLALLDDLKVKRVKIASYWDLIEPQEDNYDFTDLDWQIAEAQKRGVEILLAVGMKSPRWPECHIPGWAEKIGKEGQQEKITKFLETAVLRYRDSEAIKGWQVENEPFFVFGECPWADEDFLKKEISLIKSLDEKHRPVVIAESGEGSFWFKAAGIGDIVGITIYKKVWISQFGFYLTYPFPSVMYHRKAELVRKLFHKEVISVELQAEPWGPKLLYDTPLKEQQKTMDLEQFRYNIDLAKKTGLKEFYLWGAEWWYWMKNEQGQPEIWNESKSLFN